MAKGPNTPDRPEGTHVELEVEPTVAGRIARWTAQARILRKRVESARDHHTSIDLGFTVVERDSSIGGALLAGALAYRLFVLLLPSALLFVSGLGVYSDLVDESAGTVAQEAGLRGLVASEVAATASSSARWVVFIVMLPAVVYAIVKLYRAIAIVHAIVWHGSGRGVRITRKGVLLFTGVLLFNFAAVEIVSWIRRHDELGGLSALLVYLVLLGGAWLVVSMELPHRDVSWRTLVPGALLFGVGAQLINVFNVYITTRLVEGRADTYGVLGIAAALLFSLVLVGRLIVVSAELNASLDDRRA